MWGKLPEIQIMEIAPRESFKVACYGTQWTLPTPNLSRTSSNFLPFHFTPSINQLCKPCLSQRWLVVLGVGNHPNRCPWKPLTWMKTSDFNENLWLNYNYCENLWPKIITLMITSDFNDNLWPNNYYENLWPNYKTQLSMTHPENIKALWKESWSL